ncbi:MAG: hypothetical protein IEMM0002_0321 [bacterium]|nr:MAG: hypothetical protein IEMM0002_0321 [bacterium]
MKTENWIVSLGIVFLLFTSVIALLPDDLLEADLPNPTSGIAINPMTAGGRLVPAAALTPGANTKLPGLRNFENFPSVRFEGIVQQVSELPQHDGQIHIWVEPPQGGPQGGEQRISVGPEWFLKYTGCAIAHDIKISGVGFLFDKPGQDPMVYAKKIRIGRKVCRLRNDEGFSLWSNRLR